MRDYVEWYFYFIRGEIIRIGRLQYEFTTFKSPVRVFKRGGDVAILMDGVDMHKKGMIFGAPGQTDEEGKYFAEIKEDGDCVTGYRANIYGEADHQPVTLVGYTEPVKHGDNILGIHITNGEPFDISLVLDSFLRAGEVMKRYYPELEIKGYYGYSWVFEKHLRDIMGRDTNITRLQDLFYCFPTQGGQHGVYEYVFARPESTPTEELPEDTSMQRAIKKYLLEGNYFYEKAGIRLI
jgi:hypothetical protein